LLLWSLSTLIAVQLGFYAGLALIPAIYLIHNAATAEDPYFTRVLRRQSDFRDEWTKRNLLHDEAMHRAAEDRVLFLNQKPGVAAERRLTNIE
jgi:hypothetical protein